MSALARPDNFSESLTSRWHRRACDAEHGTATYVEPNVWVRHRTGA